MGGKARPGDDVVCILGQTRAGQVALDPAPVVEHLRIDHPARRMIDPVGRNPGQRAFGIRAGQQELGERSLVEQHGGFPAGTVFPADAMMPVGPTIGVDIAGLLARMGIPVGPFPAQFLAHDGARRDQRVVERRSSAGPRRDMLLRRPGHGVVFGIGLQRARLDPARVPVCAAKTADVHGPEIEGRRPLGDPFGKRHSGPAARGNPERVEACTDKEPRLFRRLAEDEIAIGREALGAIDQLLDTCRLQGGHTRQGAFHHRREMVEIAVEQLEGKRVGRAVDCPGDRVGLVAAHNEAADLFLPVGQPIGVAQCWQVRGHTDGLGDHVLVLDRDQRDIHTDGRGKRARPEPGTADNALAGDGPAHALYPGDAPLVQNNARDGRVFKQHCPLRPRALGQRQRNIGRIGLAVCRQKGCTDNIGDIHQGPEVLRLLRGKQMHVQTEGMGRGGLAFDFLPPLIVAGEAQAPIHLPACSLPGFGFQAFVEIDGMAQQLGDIGRGSQLPDQPGSMPCGA